jgi:hypothetical protein
LFMVALTALIFLWEYTVKRALPSPVMQASGHP